MKHLKKSNCYKASNCFFDATKIHATSYSWWTFVKVINKSIVFNNYMYSMATRGHQYKVKNTMRQLGLGCDFLIESPKSLDSSDWDTAAIKHYNGKIAEVMEALEKGIARKRADRMETIQGYRSKIAQIRMLVAVSGSVAS